MEVDRIHDDDYFKFAQGIMELGGYGTDADRLQSKEIINHLKDYEADPLKKEMILKWINRICAITLRAQAPHTGETSIRTGRQRATSVFTEPALTMPPPATTGPHPLDYALPPDPARQGDLEQTKYRSKLLMDKKSLLDVRAKLAKQGDTPSARSRLAHSRWTLKDKEQQLQENLRKTRAQAAARKIDLGEHITFAADVKPPGSISGDPVQGRAEQKRFTAEHAATARQTGLTVEQDLADMRTKRLAALTPKLQSVDAFLGTGPPKAAIKRKIAEVDKRVVIAKKEYERTARQKKRRLLMPNKYLQRTSSMVYKILHGTRDKESAKELSENLRKFKRRFLKRFTERYPDARWTKVDQDWTPHIVPQTNPSDRQEAKQVLKTLQEAPGDSQMSDHDFLAMFRMIGAPETFFQAYRENMRQTRDAHEAASVQWATLTRQRELLVEQQKVKPPPPPRPTPTPKAVKARAPKAVKARAPKRPHAVQSKVQQSRKEAVTRKDAAKKRAVKSAKAAERKHQETAQAQDQAAYDERKERKKAQSREKAKGSRSRSRSRRRRGEPKERQTDTDTRAGTKRKEHGGRPKVTQHRDHTVTASLRKPGPRSISSNEGPYMPKAKKRKDDKG